MVIAEEWAGCSIDLGITNSSVTKKGLPTWACAWGVEDNGRFVFMEIWRENDNVLFVGTQVRYEADSMGAAEESFRQSVKRKRTEGYLPVAFGDSKRGFIPSFSAGEGARIAAAGAGTVGTKQEQWDKKFSKGDLERAVVSFRSRVDQSWIGQSNAKILLAELRRIQQGVDIFCEAQSDLEACGQLREQLLAARTAVQQVLLA